MKRDTDYPFDLAEKDRQQLIKDSYKKPMNRELKSFLLLLAIIVSFGLLLASVGAFNF